MTSDEVMAKLQEAFDSVFTDRVELRRDLTAREVEGWDSLTHVSLVLAVESLFQVRFRVGEVEGMQHVGDFIDLIQRRLSER